jgi:predicted transcriptional regulator
MTQPLNLGNCCGPSIPGIRRITLPDGDRVGLVGLDTVMDALYKEGRPPDDSTVMEMIARLREKNYISCGSPAQELYQKALLNEYRLFFERKKRWAGSLVKYLIDSKLNVADMRETSVRRSIWEDNYGNFE